MKGKIRILQVGMTSNIGGLETYLIQQFRNLDKARIVYDFVNNDLGNGCKIAFEDEIKENGGKIYNIISRKKNPIKHYWQWISLLYKKRKEIQGVVLNSLGLTYVFPLLISRLFNYPIRIMHSHNSDYDIELDVIRKLIILLNKVILNFSVTDRFACSNKAGIWMFGHQKYKVIKNAINSNDFIYNEKIRISKRNEFNFKSTDYIIGHVGRFSKQKNHEFLIEIFHELTKMSGDVKLLLIGGVSGNGDTSYLERIKQLVSEYKLDDKVIFCGLRKDVNDLMQAMDCFLLPSLFEGLPVTGVEIQAAGVPCIFSDVITREVAITDDVVFLSLNDSPLVWAEKIISMRNITKKNRSKEIIDAGYDINTEVKRIMEYYEHHVNIEEKHK